MRFTARLVTERSLDRGVTKFGAGRVNVEGQARAWLDAFGKPGDRFDVFEQKDILVGAITVSHPTGISEIKK